MQYDEIGLIVTTPATFDDDGNQLTPPEYAEGWHVNTLTTIPEWEQYRIPTPDTPIRIYAGGILPVCYRFETRAAFGSMLPDETQPDGG